METDCKRADVVTWRYEALELCSQIVLPLRGMEIGSSGGALSARCLYLPQSPGGLEMRRKRVASLPQEPWTCAAGVGKSRYGDVEACCRCRDV